MGPIGTPAFEYMKLQVFKAAAEIHQKRFRIAGVGTQDRHNAGKNPIVVPGMRLNAELKRTSIAMFTILSS